MNTIKTAPTGEKTGKLRDLVSGLIEGYRNSPTRLVPAAVVIAMATALAVSNCIGTGDNVQAASDDCTDDAGQYDYDSCDFPEPPVDGFAPDTLPDSKKPVPAAPKTPVFVPDPNSDEEPTFYDDEEVPA